MKMKIADFSFILVDYFYRGQFQFRKNKKESYHVEVIQKSSKTSQRTLPQKNKQSRLWKPLLNSYQIQQFQLRMINKGYEQSMKKTQSKCSLCFPESDIDQQICYILKDLFIDINKAILQSEISQNQEFKPSSFSQLTKSVFSQVESITSITLECDHERLKNAFQQRIKCSQGDFLRASQAIFIRITKRKYQLEVLRNMLKDIPNSIDKLLLSSENFEKSEQKIQQSEQKNQESEQLNHLQNQSAHQRDQGRVQEQMMRLPQQNNNQVENFRESTVQNNSLNNIQLNQQQMYQYQQNPYGYFAFPQGYPYPYFFDPNQRF